MKLSKNFALEEFTKSVTAEKADIDNTPNPIQIGKLKNLCEDVLQPLRDALGKPITITSGFRCHKLNKLVGGAENSQHQSGEAVDFWCEDLEYAFSWIQQYAVDFDQLIWERGRWIHLSYTRNRKQVLFNKK
jgi:zinc D-Ala-D-Ala carboxypeptidase